MVAHRQDHRAVSTIACVTNGASMLTVVKVVPTLRVSHLSATERPHDHDRNKHSDMAACRVLRAFYKRSIVPDEIYDGAGFGLGDVQRLGCARGKLLGISQEPFQLGRRPRQVQRAEGV